MEVYTQCGGIQCIPICTQCEGMYPMWRYVPNVEAYSVYPYVPNVKVCTQCGGMYPMWRYVPNVEVPIQCGGTYPMWPNVEVCTQHGVIHLYPM